MGESILKTMVKAGDRARPRSVTIYFDTGSRDTFIRDDVARKLGRPVTLGQRFRFKGLGNGGFTSRNVLPLLVRLEGIWCTHIAFVASRADLDDEILAGHDFMQKYGIRLDVRRHKVLVDRGALIRSQRIR